MTAQPLTIACAQLAVSDSVAENVPVLLRAVATAADLGAGILLTPEGALSGYHADFDAAEVREAERTVVGAAAREGLALALGACYEEDDGLRYDELRFYDHGGQLAGVHAKILLCRSTLYPHTPAEVDRFATMPLAPIHIGGMVAGGLVCNDLWANPAATPVPDPHLTGRLADLGAGIVFHAANTGVARGDDLRLHRAYHESNLRLRAVAGGLWIATADVADPRGRLAARSATGIVDPSGRWIVKAADRGEAVVTATVAVERHPPRASALLSSPL